MLSKPKNLTAPLDDLIVRVKKYTSDRPLVTDIIAKLIITFGVVLTIGGLYLMLSDSNLFMQGTLSNSAVQSATNLISWIPGIPYNVVDLNNCSIATIGLVSWIAGIDLLLVGLGIWVRHQLARLAAISVFVLAAAFQVIQFLLAGILGAPASILEIGIDSVIAYCLFSTFDSSKEKQKFLPLKWKIQVVNSSQSDTQTSQ